MVIVTGVQSWAVRLCRGTVIGDEQVRQGLYYKKGYTVAEEQITVKSNKWWTLSSGPANRPLVLSHPRSALWNSPVVETAPTGTVATVQTFDGRTPVSTTALDADYSVPLQCSLLSLNHLLHQKNRCSLLSLFPDIVIQSLVWMHPIERC